MSSQSHILIIGAGNMASPIITALAQQTENHAPHITIIAGSAQSPHNAAEVSKRITRTNSSTQKLTIIERDDPEHDAQLAHICQQTILPDVVVFAAKPHFFAAIAERYKTQYQQTKHLISIAAGIEVAHMRPTLATHAHITRAMPHQPLAICGFYAENETARTEAEHLLQAYGAPILITSETAMHHYTAHAGSGPAFVAEFLRRFESTKEYNAACHSLLTLANACPTIPSSDLTTIEQRCSDFLSHWRTQAEHDLPDATAIPLVTQTIIGTITYLQQTALTPDQFITHVRSPKGTTNAGLLMLGNPCPNDSRFGTEEEIAAQQELAHSRYQSTCPETAIKAALSATINRSFAMAHRATDDPMAGISNES